MSAAEDAQQNPEEEAPKREDSEMISSEAVSKEVGKESQDPDVPEEPKETPPLEIFGKHFT